MLLMMLCVIFVGFESAEAGKRTINLPQGDLGSLPSEDVMKSLYGKKPQTIYAVEGLFIGMLVPMFFTYKAYVIRKYCAQYKPLGFRY